jgi:hypothetical protein
MKSPARRGVAALLVAACAGLAGCPEKPPQPRTAASPPAAAPLAAPAVAPRAAPPVALRGLPDFTHLVDAVGPAVVTITEVGRADRPRDDARVPPRRVADARPGTTARAELARAGRRLAVDVAVAAAPRDS